MATKLLTIRKQNPKIQNEHLCGGWKMVEKWSAKRKTKLDFVVILNGVFHDYLSLYISDNDNNENFVWSYCLFVALIVTFGSSFPSGANIAKLPRHVTNYSLDRCYDLQKQRKYYHIAFFVQLDASQKYLRAIHTAMSEPCAHDHGWTLCTRPCLNTMDTTISELYGHDHVWTLWTRPCLNSMHTTMSEIYAHYHVWTLWTRPCLNSIHTTMSEIYAHDHVWTLCTTTMSELYTHDHVWTLCTRLCLNDMHTTISELYVPDHVWKLEKLKGNYHQLRVYLSKFVCGNMPVSLAPFVLMMS